MTTTPYTAVLASLRRRTFDLHGCYRVLLRDHVAAPLKVARDEPVRRRRARGRTSAGL